MDKNIEYIRELKVGVETAEKEKAIFINHGYTLEIRIHPQRESVSFFRGLSSTLTFHTGAYRTRVFSMQRSAWLSIKPTGKKIKKEEKKKESKEGAATPRGKEAKE